MKFAILDYYHEKNISILNIQDSFLTKFVIQDNYALFFYDHKLIMIGCFSEAKKPLNEILLSQIITTLEFNFKIRKYEINKNAFGLLSSDRRLYIHGKNIGKNRNLGLGPEVTATAKLTQIQQKYKNMKLAYKVSNDKIQNLELQVIKLWLSAVFWQHSKDNKHHQHSLGG